MVLRKISLTVLFHDLIDHLGYLLGYICFTTSLLSMLSTGAAEARSCVHARLRTWVWVGAGRDRRWVISSQIRIYIGASIWHPLMENGRSLLKKSAAFFLRD